MAAIGYFSKICLSQSSTRIHQQLFTGTRRSFKSLSRKQIAYLQKDLNKEHRLVNISPFQVLSRVSYHGAHANGWEEPQNEVKTSSLVKSLWPYIWPKGRQDIKVRVFLSFGCLFGAKGVTCYVPFLFKDAVNFLNDSSNWLSLSDPSATLFTGATVCLLGYGISRITASFFNEAKNTVFSKVSHNSIRTVAQEVFLHLHGLDLSYHLSRQTGALAKDIDRGLKGISTLISSIILNLFPTILEVTIVMAILSWKYGTMYSLVGLGTITAYSIFTIFITQWRTKFRRAMNKADRDAGNQAIDSLINYETVKYFNNEIYEAQKYDKFLERYQKASLKTASSLSGLNFGQNSIFTIGLSTMMILASQSIMAGTLTVGDMVMINALLFQVSLPLSFLGSVYRDTMQAKTDTSSMFHLLTRKPKVATLPNATELKVTKKDASISFNDVTFGYLPDKSILDGLSFTVPAGKTVAIVGGSGSGKSTVARLMFRFFDPDSGSVTINNQDIKSVNLESLRRSIGIVPQDCVLFHDNIFNNIQYGDMSKSADDVFHAAKIAKLHDKILNDFPKQYDTEVGERGLKLSGGEKQRVAIARVIMKDAPIFIYDEATSSLDSITERSILEALTSITSGRTTIMIAHRLSTVKDADIILVLKNGKVMEKGTHRELLSNEGSYYRELWETQTSIPTEEVVQDKAELLKE